MKKWVEVTTKKNKKWMVILSLFTLSFIGGCNDNELVPINQQIDVQRAYDLGDLCVSAYDQYFNFEDDKSWSVPTGYKLIKELYAYEWGDTARERTVPIGFIATKDDDAYIVFRGTVTLEEWIKDLEVVFTSTPSYLGGGEVSRGTVNIYNQFRSTMLKSLNFIKQDINSEIDRIFVTGHSLGGGLADIASVDLSLNGDHPVIMYTYGSPRTGKQSFKAVYDQHLRSGKIEEGLRVANTYDVVPTLPPMVLGYIHIGQEHVVRFDGGSISGDHSIKTYRDQFK